MLHLDTGRLQATWHAAQEYRRTRTLETCERLLAAWVACRVASQVPLETYWVRRVLYTGGESGL
jgi:hypothetical protein